MADIFQESPDVKGEALESGRMFAAGISLLCMVLMAVSALVGLLLMTVGWMGSSFGAWQAEEPLTTMLIGALFLGVVPGLFSATSLSLWEEVRTLVYPILFVVVGLFLVSLLNFALLYAASGGTLFTLVFSAGWLGVLGFLASIAPVALWAQLRTVPGPPPSLLQPLPAWSKPLVALLGSAWFGLGAGLLAMPDFWGGFIPWGANRMDCQSLGVLALAPGIGLLGALAEDDLQRLRPALAAVMGISLLLAATFFLKREIVDWASGPGLAVVGLVAGLLLTGIIGLMLRADTKLDAEQRGQA